MTGIHRSSLSYRTVLVLLVLLGTPIAVRSDTLEDSARKLAGKIVAALPSREGIAVDIQNISTLTPREVDRVSQALSGVLQDSGISVSLNGGGAIHVSVTLSENVKGFVWSAEISRGDASRVVLAGVPRILEDRPVSNSMPIALRSAKFWEGPEQILDAAEVISSNSASIFYLLQPDGLIIHKKDSDSSFKVEIPPAQAATRIPTGSFVQIGNACQPFEFASCVTVTLDSQICTIALDKRALGECHGQAPPSGRGRPLVTIQSHCGDGTQFLSTGTSDYTQPDSVQALDGGSVAISNELDFPGPILALNVLADAPTMATAVVRNLKTGNYEAHRLSISCGQ